MEQTALKAEIRDGMNLFERVLEILKIIIYLS